MNQRHHVSATVAELRLSAIKEMGILAAWKKDAVSLACSALPAWSANGPQRDATLPQHDLGTMRTATQKYGFMHQRLEVISSDTNQLFMIAGLEKDFR